MNEKVQIKSGADARSIILEGAKQLCDIVSSTLGPGGKNVLLKHLNEKIIQSTKDGVTVARFIELENEWENIGSNLLKQSSMRTAINAGDGTTSTVIFAYSLMCEINEFLKNNPDYNVHKLRDELNTCKDLMIEYIKEKSIISKTNQDIRNIAMISTNGDEKISNLIASAYEKFGNEHGAIVVEPSPSTETSISIQSGIKVASGYTSYMFMTDTNKMVCELNNCGVLITDQPISKGSDMLKLLGVVNDKHDSLLIIAENIEGEAVQTLVANHLQKKMQICLVKPTFYGERRKDYLSMIASAINSKPFYVESGNKLSDFSNEYVGTAEKVIITKDETTIQIYENNKVKLDFKIAEITSNIKSMVDKGVPEESEDIQWKRNLLSFAKGNIATIRLGGNSDTEIYEVKDRIDDAIAAVKSSLEEGVSVGAGVSYIRAANSLPSTLTADLIKSASCSIKRKLLSNLCAKDIDILINFDIISKGNSGINRDFERVDLMESGIIDPTKVVRNCVENAVSVATMFLLTDNIAMKVEDLLI